MGREEIKDTQDCNQAFMQKIPASAYQKRITGYKASKTPVHMWKKINNGPNREYIEAKGDTQ